MTSAPRFVLHDHRKPSPHFDLRREEDGVLRSWAVSLHDRRGVRRYALIHTGGSQWLLHLTKEQARS